MDFKYLNSFYLENNKSLLVNVSKDENSSNDYIITILTEDGWIKYKDTDIEKVKNIIKSIKILSKYLNLNNLSIILSYFFKPYNCEIFKEIGENRPPVMPSAVVIYGCSFPDPNLDFKTITTSSSFEIKILKDEE